MIDAKKRIQLVAALTLASMGLTQVAFQRPAHAIIAGATAGAAIPALVVLGASLIGTAGGAGLVTLGISTGRECGDCTAPDTLIYGGGILTIGGVIGILVGVVMLDQTGSPTLQFRPLDSLTATERGILPAEQKAFNRQLQRINGISETIAQKFADPKITDANQALRLADEIWKQACHDQQISALACSALSKNSQHFAQQLEQASQKK
ncbi:hypothetical protein WDW37_02270 [Bdellovibrionota bacterium FG-1]